MAALGEEVLYLDRDQVVDEHQIRKKLVGRILTEKNVNKITVKKSIKRMWGEPQGLIISSMGTNTYLFNFKHEEDAIRIHGEGPWRVDGHMLSLKWWSSELSFEEVCYNSIAIWVQIHALPLEKLNKSNAEKIGTSLGKLIEVEDPYVDRNLLRNFLRVKVEVNALEQLKTGFQYKRNNSRYSWASFKYERLYDYCYNCGRIGHDRRSCRKEKAMAIDKSNLLRYGPDLSAPGLRSISSLAEKAGIEQKSNGIKILETNSWVACGKNSWNREWVTEEERECRPIQEQVDTVEAGGTGADLHATRRFQQQMGIEDMSREKDTQYLGNGAGQNMEKETKKDKDRIVGITEGEQNIPTMMGIREKEVQLTIENFLKTTTGGDKRDKEEKNELKKRVQRENNPDQRDVWWNYRERAKTVSNYLQAGQQIYNSDDGGLYIVELANEEDEKEEVAKQAESIAKMWEIELARHINNSLKLKRRRDDETPMMIEGAENEEEEAERAGLYLEGRKKCRKEAIYEEQEGQRMQIQEKTGKILMAGEAGFNIPPTKPRVLAKEKSVSRIKRRLHFDNIFCVELRDLSGGLSLFWNEKYDVEVYFWNNNLIKTYVDDRKGNRWIGSRCTWFSNPRNGFVTRERIDRVMANWEWWSLNQQGFPFSFTGCEFRPLILEFKNHSNLRYNWTDHKECKEIVKKGWNKGGETNSEGAGVGLRIKKLQGEIKKME
ncbi:hypothetical protein Ahy_B10g101285 [Arachis hypogaea]|uniref:CCHC-type domain-containing protein n=1 Tax=Arachis hypogaea TaxID=3818 RepID=A0A444WZ69_ARAHY|nr:hypothetical protein Ahy_B10g101285 [Arachis hypogaea]